MHVPLHFLFTCAGDVILHVITHAQCRYDCVLSTFRAHAASNEYNTSLRALCAKEKAKTEQEGEFDLAAAVWSYLYQGSRKQQNKTKKL